MQYATLGHSGLLVSRLAFGAMTFGTGTMVPGVQNRIEQSEADRMVARALDAGVTLFDTADAYVGGESEIMLGKALRARRGDVVISTKVGFRAGSALTDTGASYRHIMRAAEASLKRLGTEWIDVYHLHKPDPLTPMEETVRALDALMRQGKVRYVGFSNFPAWQAVRMLGLQEQRGAARFVSAQMYYSLLGRDLEHECVPFYAAAGIGVMAWSPLASGFLSGKYTRRNPVPPDARRKSFEFPPIDVERGYDVVDALSEIARARSASPAQVALAWVLTRPFVSSVLLGASRMSQLDDNLAAAELPLAGDEVARLEQLTAPKPIYPNWFVDAMAWDGAVRDALGKPQA